jgi:hypothetical protein
MVQDDERVGLDGVRVVFDDDRVVSDAGIALVGTLAGRLGIEQLVGRFVALCRDRPGAANPGRKVVARSCSRCCLARIRLMIVMCCARVARAGCWWLAAGAPSTLGTFLRAFTFGHVRQLDRVLAESLTRAWRAGAGPGAGRLIVDVDSFIGQTYGYLKEGVGFGATPNSAGITRCSRAARAPARFYTFGSGRDRRTRSAVSCVSPRS